LLRQAHDLTVATYHDTTRDSYLDTIGLKKQMQDRGNIVHGGSELQRQSSKAQQQPSKLETALAGK